MSKSAIAKVLSVVFIVIISASARSANAQSEPFSLPSFDPTTGILNLPYVALFEDGAFTNVQVQFTAPIVLAASEVSQAITPQIAMGGMAYSKYWETAAGGSGGTPIHADYTRCKACHGWDLMGTDGGYVRRSDGGGSRSAAVPIKLNRFDYTADQILNGSWTPGVDDPTTSHPNFDGILTTAQVNALLAYLNSPNAKFVPTIGTVYNAPNPAQYTIPFGNASRGQTGYASHCQVCHGMPEEDSANFIAGGPDGGLLAFFIRDGKPSELAHKSMWGEVGTLMTRVSMGDPTPLDVADIVKYLQSLSE